ncbi:ABC transporter permease [Actinoplanes subglobosus]|uniref:ABC transporter permease n=1 Tax=Actinoplanes subglobosus TaxID=1547892 RepID=A0ABV8IXE5_9ACTN
MSDTATRRGHGLPAVGPWLVVALFVLVALAGPLLVTADPLRHTTGPLLPFGAPGHPLGTDDLGRDLLARMVYGARPLLLVSSAATTVAALLGIGAGLLAGYVGGTVGWLVTALTDVALTFPPMLVIILLVAAWRPGVASLVTGIGVTLAPGLARLARVLTAGEASRDYVLAARIGGARTARILVVEVLPNIAGPLLAQVLMTLSIAAGLSAGMSYLGLGIPPPAPDWGSMAQAGQEFLHTAPRLVTLPAAASLLFVVACNLAGDQLRDRTDRRRSR